MIAPANPRSRLALRISSQKCAPTFENSFKAAFKAVSRVMNRTDLLSSLSYGPHQGRQSPVKKHLNDQQTTSVPHNSHQYHRDQSACGFLLVT